jgi:hypothetical protein
MFACENEVNCMSATERSREQISVKLDAELMAAVERAAAAEHRTVSAQVRHFVACMIEARQPPQVAA